MLEENLFTEKYKYLIIKKYRGLYMLIGKRPIEALILILSILVLATVPATTLWPFEQEFRPLVAGVKIETIGIIDDEPYIGQCSIGFPAYYDTGWGIFQWRHFGIITAGHCSWWMRNWDVHQPYVDPDDYDRYLIGSVTKVGSHNSHYTIIYIDAEFVETETIFWTFNPPSSSTISPYIFDYYETLGTNLIPIDGVYPESNLQRDLEVYSVGFVTGLKDGYVIEWDRDWYVNGTLFKNLIKVDDMLTYEGDSGSPLFYVEYEGPDPHAQILGTLVGGPDEFQMPDGRWCGFTNYFAQVWETLDDLDINVYTDG